MTCLVRHRKAVMYYVYIHKLMLGPVNISDFLLVLNKISNKLRMLAPP